MMRLKIVYCEQVNNLSAKANNQNDVIMRCHGNVKRQKSSLAFDVFKNYSVKGFVTGLSKSK